MEILAVLTMAVIVLILSSTNFVSTLLGVALGVILAFMIDFCLNGFDDDDEDDEDEHFTGWEDDEDEEEPDFRLEDAVRCVKEEGYVIEWSCTAIVARDGDDGILLHFKEGLHQRGRRLFFSQAQDGTKPTHGSQIVYFTRVTRSEVDLTLLPAVAGGYMSVAVILIDDRPLAVFLKLTE